MKKQNREQIIETCRAQPWIGKRVSPHELIFFLKTNKKDSALLEPCGKLVTMLRLTVIL
jgi:hypothetical protein